MPYSGSRPQFLTLDQSGRYFTTADGKPFFWLADTQWYGLTDRVSLSEFKRILQQRKRQGFTVVLLVVGVPPEVPIDSVEAHANGQAPFLDTLPNPQYYDAIEEKIKAVLETGLTPCLVGGWGPQMTVLGEDAMLAQWKVMVERFSSLPVVWCLTGELDLPLVPGAATGQSWRNLIPPRVRQIVKKLIAPVTPNSENQVAAWGRIGQWISENDPNHHPILLHPHTKKLASEIYPDAKWLQIDSIQSGHDLSRVGFIVTAAQVASKKRLFINLEPWYENIGNQFGPSDQRAAFWMSVLSGAHGHTYGADGLWNMRTQDKFLSHWGETTWQDALRLRGADHLGKATTWLLSQNWWQLETCSEFIATPWSETALWNPVVGAMGNKKLMYVPERCPLTQVKIVGDQSWEATQLDTKSLRILKRQKIDKTNTLTIRSTDDANKDELWLFQPTKS